MRITNRGKDHWVAVLSFAGAAFLAISRVPSSETTRGLLVGLLVFGGVMALIDAIDQMIHK
ncbi:MAG: hypothetical protein Q8P69_00290 [bacterium]|nr:hypothetical protein [bacterium]